MYNFLIKLLIEITPSIKKFLILKTKYKNYNNVSFNLDIKNLTIHELKNYYNLSKTISYLNITIVTNTKTKKELFFLLKSFNLPFRTILISNTDP